MKFPVLWLSFVSRYSEGDIPRMGLTVLFVYLLALFKVSKFLFSMITHNISDLFRQNTNNCKNGEEAHNETVRAYGAMGFLKLD